jgi:hypothetical protein
MFRAFGLALLIIAMIGSIIWGFNRHEMVLEIQLQLSSTQQELSSTQQELNSTQQELNSAQEELSSTELTIGSLQQELNSAELTISSLESKLELYEDTWGLVASGIQPPFQGADIVSSGTATNPTWAQLSDFLLEDRTDQKAYVPGVYVCSDFARDVHNNAERAGIRAAYAVVELPSDYHALNAFRTTDRGLVFIDCTGLQASDSGPSNRDKSVNVRLGKSYIPRSLFPEAGWSVTWGNMGTVRDVEIYW